MTDPAEQAPAGTKVDGVAVLGAISPSRAADFKACPLLYRLRTIDRLPEVPSAPAIRGTLVHKVLEDLFDVPAADRTLEQARALVPASWKQILGERPEAAALLESLGIEADDQNWLESCHEILSHYFDLEDPTRIEPAERELYVETLLDSKLLLRGVVDRIDIAPDGAIRISDYKSARSPGESYEAKALFQMRFYALVLWRTRGVVPAVLRLMYLGNSEVLSYSPDEQDLLATQRQVQALWDAIQVARDTGVWLPQRSGMCSWCSYQEYCPEFGGTPPPLPQSAEQQGAQVLDAEPCQGVDENPPVPL